MSLTVEILRYLRSRYETATGRPMISDSSMKSPQAEFYFQRLEDNLIEAMCEETEKAYRSGDGNELEEKMRALRSSSAMTYNLLGNGTVEVKKDSPFFVSGEYMVSYEKQLPTIKRNPHKANLDAYLKGEKQLIFCEMKMTEWLFNRPGYLRESYKRKELYLHPEIFDAAMMCLEEIVLQEPSDHKTYYSSLEQYDGLQMFKHLLAIYNFAAEYHGSIPQSIRLVNCVWHLPESAGISETARKEYQQKETKEHQEFERFYSSTKKMREAFADLGIDFDIVLMTAKEFSDQFIRTMEQKKYLARYFG